MYLDEETLDGTRFFKGLFWGLGITAGFALVVVGILLWRAL